MSVRKGDEAPAFKRPAASGEEIDLAQYIGREKIVLLFFPLAFSPVCTEEMCHVRDSWSQWESIGAKVFGISVDSPFVTAKFRELERIPFPILSDFHHDVSRQYGVLHDDPDGLRGVAKRSAFVIDQTGKVIYCWITDEPRNRVPFEEIKAAIGEPAAATG